MKIADLLIESWINKEGNVSNINEILQWVSERNSSLKVNVRKIDFMYDGFWHYDESDGYIRNDNNSFFQLAGYQEIENDTIVVEQPIILQNEIGYLGIICKEIDGVLNFLMQAKIEPGNVNKIQISPTIQATKSNFTKKHGGKTPDYLNYFVDAADYTIIVDQIQSEQASRFYKKRNRNIIIMVEDDIKILDSHKWMTLGQIKELMKVDNLVNMDTRTVLSCLPFGADDVKEYFEEHDDVDIVDKAFINSVTCGVDLLNIGSAFNKINEYKMYSNDCSRLVPIRSLKSWEMTKNEIRCRSDYGFKVVFCNIEIEGREIKYWEQPLLEATGEYVFGLISSIDDAGIRRFLVKVRHELGCFDQAELGPTVQMIPDINVGNLNKVEELFFENLDKSEAVMYNVILSEEGGRFYHEQNRNVILDVPMKIVNDCMTDEYLWMSFADLNCMIQFNNCLNIQLRNLLSLIEI